MADPRLEAADNFTPTIHHSIPDEVQPERFVLSADFTVCIVGAGQGIGEHIAYAYARARAAKLVLAARTESDLVRVADSCRQLYPDIEVATVTCDIAMAPSVKALADAVRARFDRLDLLICNAAYAGPVTLRMDEGEPEWVQRAFDVNVMGTYHAAHYFVPLLLETVGGAKAFVAVGSFAGLIRRGIIANTGYCVSKMAQMRLVEYLHEQYGADGLFAITVHPGAVMTNMARGNTPAAFVPHLVDDVAHCGAICVWLSAKRQELDWLSGRFISAQWDMPELLARRTTIEQKDLLKLALVVD